MKKYGSEKKKRRGPQNRRYAPPFRLFGPRFQPSPRFAPFLSDGLVVSSRRSTRRRFRSRPSSKGQRGLARVSLFSLFPTPGPLGRAPGADSLHKSEPTLSLLWMIL